MTRVKMNPGNNKPERIKTAKRITDRRDLLFVFCLIAFPALQFIVFYIITNINSFVLAFQSYDATTGFQFAGFENFKQVFYDLVNTPEVIKSLSNSFLVYGVNLFINIVMCILFSYYIFKGYVGHKIFKVMLFLPSIISVLTLCMIIRYFSDEALPEIASKLFSWNLEGLFANGATRYGALMFVYIFFGMGTSMLMYVGAMSGIDQSMLEAANIDGAGSWQELTRIILPQIYPTIKTFFICGTAALFIDQFNLFNFYGIGADINYSTMGYYFYKLTVQGRQYYPYVAAFGLVVSAVLIPVTIALNKWLENRNPMR